MASSGLWIKLPVPRYFVDSDFFEIYPGSTLEELVDISQSTYILGGFCKHSLNKHRIP